ncbi:MAG: (R)-specific enoyl-CoA hydratase [Firmicutes bacterium]|nr:(R)-specific enoyl-CoA hydratase [candidate division NPL-UPA2 bacterium]
MFQDVKFADIKVGDTASMSKTISESDIYLFAGVTGDFNPVHINEEFAKTTMFKGRIAHGMLSVGLISAVLGTALPGANTIYLAQELSFRAPVRIGDTVTATVEVLEKIDGKNRIILRTTATTQDGTLVIDGKATVMKK